MRQRFDVVCIGGGVIGLMTALELAKRGKQVAVIDRQALAQEASWAGAGILPPANLSHASSAMEKLRAVSFESYPVLARELRNLTGHDIELNRTGGIEIAESESEAAELESLVPLWHRLGIAVECLTAADVALVEPALSRVPHVAYRFVDLHQIRNPRLMKALVIACQKQGVVNYPADAVQGFDVNQGKVNAVTLQSGATVSAPAFLLAAGAWSATILKRIDVEIPVRPVQGQMVAIQTDGSTVRHVVMAGKRYFVPRRDGLLLVGSTEDNVGFEKRTTDTGIGGLIQFAHEHFPRLKDCEVVKTWAGLRPGLDRGFPILGRVPGLENLWLATGHFRQGIQLAPGTAQLMAEWITTGQSFANERDFALDATSASERAAFRS